MYIELFKDGLLMASDLAKIFGVATGIGISAGQYPYFNQLISGNPTDKGSAAKTGKQVGLGIGATDNHDWWGKNVVAKKGFSQVALGTYRQPKKYRPVQHSNSHKQRCGNPCCNVCKPYSARRYRRY